MDGLKPYISRFPNGLLSLLGIQQQGRYPVDLAAGYTPTFEVLNWVVQAHTEDALSDLNTQGPVTAGSTIAPQFNGANFGPPVGEIWVVSQLAGSFSFSAVAGSSVVNLTIGVLRTPDANAYFPVCEPHDFASAATASVGIHLRSDYPYPLVLTGGQRIAYSFGALTVAAGASFFSRARASIVRLKP